MKNRLPTFLDKDKVCIICEGDEDTVSHSGMRLW